MRKVGVDAVRALVPEQQTQLIEHIRKCKEREKRQKTEHWKATRKDKEGEDDDNGGVSHKPLQDYDSIMRDDELAAEDQATAAAAAAGGARGSKAKASGGVKSGKDVNAMWIRDGDVDFLDASVAGKVSASDPRADALALAASRRGVALGHGVEQDKSSGKLVIAGGAKKTAAQLSGAAAAAMLDIDELDLELKSKHREKRKRQQQEDDEAADEDEQAHTVKRQQLPGQQFRVRNTHTHTRTAPTHARMRQRRKAKCLLPF